MLAPAVLLGDVVDLIGGGTPPKSNENFYEGNIPWATVRDMKQEQLFETEFQISEEAVKKSSTNIIEAGNVVTATRVGLGKVCILQQDTAINQDLKGLIPKDSRLDKQYLFWWLKSVAHVIEAAGVGATVKGVKIHFIKALEIPLPSIPEQKRIVAILDQAFTDIDKARALTEQNLKNARELFESYLQQVFSQRGEGWVNSTVGDQLTLQRGFDITKKQQNPGEIPVVSSGGLKSFHDEYKVEAPGVVIGRKGSLGTVFYLEENFWPHDTTLWVKDFKGNDPKLVYYFFRGLEVKNLDSGAANPALNRNMVHPLEVSWPEKSRQAECIAALDSLSGKVEKLGRLYLRKAEALDDLKKSLLQKAFSGELTNSSAEAAA